MNDYDGEYVATLVQMLNEKGITRVAIIDDAYDQPAIADMSDEDIAIFWTQVDEEYEARKELEALGFIIENQYDVTDQLIKTLWERRDELKLLKTPFDSLSKNFNLKQAELAPLYTLLSQNMERQVVRCGYATVDDIGEDTKLIFLDYYLGPTRDPEAVEKASQIAQKIYERHEPAGVDKPLIILMSSLPLAQEDIDNFRDNSGLLGGLFHFVKKEEISDWFRLTLKLKSFIQTMEHGNKIQHFLEVIGNSVDEIVNRFVQDIKKLSVADYAFIQMLSLQEDGHPLGDYMVWMYGAYFGHLMFSHPGIREHEGIIDRITFDSIPFGVFKPSLQLAEIYKSTLFDLTVNDVGPHPRDGDDKNPYLQLGDVFIKDEQSNVWMVINADCDLSFAPDADRPFPSSRSILLIPGRLQVISNIPDTSKARTELFEFEGQTYRILWDTKRIMTQPYQDIYSWKKEQGYIRYARLRLPFALEIQRSFAADLTRIGMPVSPPIYRPVKVDVYYADMHGKARLLGTSSNSWASVFLTSRGEKCVMSEDFVCQVREYIENVTEQLTARFHHLDALEQGAPTEDRKAKFQAKKRTTQERIEKMVAFRAKSETLEGLRQPFLMKTDGTKQKLSPAPIELVRNKSILVGGNFDMDEPILLTITDSIREEPDNQR